MPFTLTIECENCSSKEVVQLKRVKDEFGGKVYEDYSVVGDSINESEAFSSSQTFDNVTYVTCKNCGKEHELHI